MCEEMEIKNLNVHDSITHNPINFSISFFSFVLTEKLYLPSVIHPSSPSAPNAPVRDRAGVSLFSGWSGSVNPAADSAGLLLLHLLQM